MKSENGLMSKSMVRAIKQGLAGMIMLTASTAQAYYIAYTIPDFANIYTAPTGSAWCTSCGNFAEVSDQFTLTSAATLWWTPSSRQKSSKFKLRVHIQQKTCCSLPGWAASFSGDGANTGSARRPNLSMILAPPPCPVM